MVKFCLAVQANKMFWKAKGQSKCFVSRQKFPILSY